MTTGDKRHLQKTETLWFEPSLEIPNNQTLPVLFYHAVLDPHVADKAAQFEKHFAANGWGGTWRNGIFDYHHFHSNAHEVLGIAKGAAEIMLGGKTGKLLTVSACDMLVLPAGTGHKCIEASDDFLVVGAYPQGQEDYDVCRDTRNEPEAAARIGFVTMPVTDPFYGPDGPLLALWVSEPKARTKR